MSWDQHYIPWWMIAKQVSNPGVCFLQNSQKIFLANQHVYPYNKTLLRIYVLQCLMSSPQNPPPKNLKTIIRQFRRKQHAELQLTSFNQFPWRVQPDRSSVVVGPRSWAPQCHPVADLVELFLADAVDVDVKFWNERGAGIKLIEAWRSND